MSLHVSCCAPFRILLPSLRRLIADTVAASSLSPPRARARSPCFVASASSDTSTSTAASTSTSTSTSTVAPALQHGIFTLTRQTGEHQTHQAPGRHHVSEGRRGGDADEHVCFPCIDGLHAIVTQEDTCKWNAQICLVYMSCMHSTQHMLFLCVRVLAPSSIANRFASTSFTDLWLLICYMLRPTDVCRASSTCHIMSHLLLTPHAHYWARLYRMRYRCDMTRIAALPHNIRPHTGADWHKQYAWRGMYADKRAKHVQRYYPINIDAWPTAWPTNIVPPTATPPTRILRHAHGFITFHAQHTQPCHVYDTRPRTGITRPSEKLPMTDAMWRDIQAEHHIAQHPSPSDVHVPVMTHAITHTHVAVDVALSVSCDVLMVMSSHALELIRNPLR